MPHLVSILIPAYNAEKWIGDSIKSALSQTWPQTEIIIVDDESSDNTLHIAKQYESRSVKVLTQPHAGASAARNKALSFAQGEYIQWLDADDLLAPDKISKQLRLTDSGRDSLTDRKSTRLNTSHDQISYAVFCLKKKKHPTLVQNRAGSDSRNTKNAS